MFDNLFQQELDSLRELGAEFAGAHPAVAPMLSGPSADPDVERLLEGVAFLTALLRRKLDDDFPEIVHELIHLIFPHYLRPMPSATIVAFMPKPVLKQPVTIDAETTYIASEPVEGTKCIFKPCYDVEVHPMRITNATLVEPSAGNPAIRLEFELNGVRVSDWEPGALRLFISGAYGEATHIYMLLRNHLASINIRSMDTNTVCVLSPDHLKPVGFSDDEGLVPYPSQSFSAYRLLQEYFILPEKFLFLDVTGWENWTNRGDSDRFQVDFELQNLHGSLPKIKTDHFILSATPAVNLFPNEADPIRLDHKKSEYMVRPSGADYSHYQIYSVEGVTGFNHATAEKRPYHPFEVFDPEPESGAIYHIRHKKSPVRTGYNTFLSVVYPEGSRMPEAETLSIDLICSNGFLAESLKKDDIHLPTGSSPEFVEFTNIRPPTPNIMPPMERNLLWRLLSHLSLNYLSLANANNFRTLLDLYIFEDTWDRTTILANRKRITGIRELEARQEDRLISGVLMRGPAGVHENQP